MVRAIRSSLEVLATTGTLRNDLEQLVDFADGRLDEISELDARYRSG